MADGDLVGWPAFARAHLLRDVRDCDPPPMTAYEVFHMDRVSKGSRADTIQTNWRKLPKRRKRTFEKRASEGTVMDEYGNVAEGDEVVMIPVNADEGSAIRCFARSSLRALYFDHVIDGKKHTPMIPGMFREVDEGTERAIFDALAAPHRFFADGDVTEHGRRMYEDTYKSEYDAQKEAAEEAVRAPMDADAASDAPTDDFLSHGLGEWDLGAEAEDDDEMDDASSESRAGAAPESDDEGFGRDSPTHTFDVFAAEARDARRP
jgi:hypothetical protein